MRLNTYFRHNYRLHAIYFTVQIDPEASQLWHVGIIIRELNNPGSDANKYVIHSSA